MQIAISSMENVTHREIERIADGGGAQQGLCQTAAGDGAINNDVSRGQAGQCANRTLAAIPDSGALSLGLGQAHI